MKADYETEAINRFLSFLKETRGVEYAIAAEDVIVDPATSTNYDYRLEAPNAQPLAVEVFRLVESEEEVQERRHLGVLWQAIKTEFGNAGLKDLFVHTPYESPVRPRKATEYAKALAERVVREMKARPDVKKFHLDGGFEVHRADGLGGVMCGSHSDARSIDPVGIAKPPLLKNRSKKDRQLATTGCGRIALCANWAYSVDGDNAADALALIDTSGLMNIDEVYFDNGKAHRVVYARSVRDALAGDVQVVLRPEEKAPVDVWLSARLGKDMPGSFEIATKMIEHAGSASLFSDRYTREAMVRAASKRVDSGGPAAGLWAVTRFRDDPDPPLEDYPDDPDGTFNYHEQIKRGEHPSAPVSVRADVCWLIQRLICKAPEQSWHLIGDVERLAADPNLHIRQNACVALIEFVRLRLWTDEAGRNRMPEDVRARAKALAFKMLRDNRDYPGVLDRVATIFTYLPDVEQSEAEEVLGSLVGAGLDRGLEAVAWLLVFFSVFRSGHPQCSGTFDPSPFAARLTDELVHGSERLRHSIAFTIFRTVEEDPSTAQALKRYILMLPESDLTGHAPHHFYKAVQPLVDAGPDDEVERAVLKMIRTEVAWSVAGPGRFMALLGIAPVLKRLGANGRWDVVLDAIETAAAAHPPLIGSLGELESLVRSAPESHVDRLRHAISRLQRT